jgi:hypothetical protein
MLVQLDESETKQLYQELLAHFNLIGASNHCQALESAWKDPYTRQKIEEFIRAWLRRKQKKKQNPSQDWSKHEHMSAFSVFYWPILYVA